MGFNSGFKGFMGVSGKAAGRETDQSPPSIAEVKNKWTYTSTPFYAFVTLLDLCPS